MIDPEFLKMLCCPETHQELHVAEGPIVERLNRVIAAGKLRNRTGQTVQEKLDSGLVRADGKLLYPVHQDIPMMLVDEAIPISEEPGRAELSTLRSSSATEDGLLGQDARFTPKAFGAGRVPTGRMHSR